MARADEKDDGAHGPNLFLVASPRQGGSSKTSLYYSVAACLSGPAALKSGEQPLTRRVGKMADSFDPSASSHEKKFKLDAETEFKVAARRNKMLGLWLAERLGITSSEVEAYAKEVVLSDLEEPGDDDVIRKVMKDIAEHGADVTEETVREKLDEFYEAAAAEFVD
jgi:hypothetical protein